MRAVSIHQDVVVVVSGFWQTTATLVRAETEAFLIDSPVLPAELEALPALAEQSGFGVIGLLATHGDWDHLLGRAAFGEAALGVGEATAQRLRAEPGAAQRELRDFDEKNYIERPPLGLGDVQALPVPGKLEIGEEEMELHPADGHTGDGVAYLLRWASVLVVGDYLSPVEIPWISESGNVDAYLATLSLLESLVARVETVVPGHGSPMASSRALELLIEDREYLEALRRDGEAARLPAGRDSAEQKRIHREVNGPRAMSGR